ncbi:MAG: carbohydrate ABC transporter permease [Clostridia bacterium]|nr:carbohydrate ABC transporter permease [Clostridia bacterium]
MAYGNKHAIKPSKERRDKMSPLTVVMLVLLTVYAIMLLYILYWGFITSLKEPWFEFGINKLGLPSDWSDGHYPFRNYVTVFNHLEATPGIKVDGVTQLLHIGFPQMLLNTVLYSIGGAFFNTLVPCITSYLCAKYRYKFSKIVYGTVLVVMMIPIVGSLASEVQMAQNFGLYDSIFGMWIMKANFLGLYFLVFYEMFRSMPAALSEAAQIDGAGDLGIMLRIAMPLAKNTFLTVLLINFVALWNDYQTPLVYLPTHPTLADQMYWIQSKSGELSPTPVKVAAAYILIIPTSALFIAFHNRLLGNLTIGGVKG